MKRHDLNALHQTVSPSLSVDVVATVKDFTSDLSTMVDKLPARSVQNARRGADNAGLDEVIVALNGFHAEHGFLSGEFSDL